MSESREKPDATSANTAGDDEGETFLHRWSRRKHEARAQPPASPAPQAPPEQDPKPPERILTDADMPPLESLGEDSDFSMFLSAGVSEHLRQRALRKLFTLPSINQRCPLDGEWYDSHGYEPLGNIITHEMREAMEREAEKLKQSAMETLTEQNSATADNTAERAASAFGEPALAPAAQSTAGEADEARASEQMREPSAPKEKNA